MDVFDKAINEILKAKMEGREPVLPEGVTAHINYGSSSKICKCNCTEGDCEHNFNGEWIELENGGSASCSRCGMLAMSHDMNLF